MKKEKRLLSTAVRNSIVCCAFPLMRTNRKIYMAKSDYEKDAEGRQGIRMDHKVELSNESLYAFIEDVGASYIYAIKFSQVPPFDYLGEGIYLPPNYSDSFIYLDDAIDESNDLLIMGEYKKQPFKYDGTEYSHNVIAPYGESYGNNVEAIETGGRLTELGNVRFGALNVLGQVNINIDMPYKLKDVEFTFKISDIVGADHDLKYNPKLLSSDYMGFVLSDNLQNGAEYDILKLGKNDLNILYTEALTPDITKRYIRLAKLNGYYVPEIAENLTGYVVTDDTSLVIEGSQYQSMLANNKNFFLQNTLNRENSVNQVLSSSVGTIGSGLASGGWVGGALGAASSLFSLASTAMKNNNDIVNESLTIDNLKNAPNSINGAKGNVIFNAMYSDLGVVVEIHDILPHEKKIVDDAINMSGMTLNKVANIKNYDNVRHYHNYIKANIENIIGDISNPIREDIRQRFANGVRFWNEDSIQYKKENYERWLNNE